MAPMTKSGLVVLTTASLAFADRLHARNALHSHKRSKPYSAAPFGYTNGTMSAVGPTGTGTGTSEPTSTRTETLFSTVYNTVTAAATGANLAVSGASEPTCGGTVYVTVTDTVTAGTGSTSSTSAAASSSTTTTLAPAGDYPSASSSAAATTPAASSTTAAASSSAPVAYTTLATTTSAPSTTEAVTTTTPAAYTSSAAATTTSASASASPSAYSGSGLRTKRGCLYNDAGDCSTLAGSSDTISWAANWASTSGGGAGSNVFIPQLWGHYSNDGSTDFTTGFTANVEAALSAGATAVMGYNEPDGTGAGQSDLSATGDAIAQWHYVSQFSGKATIVSPSICSTYTNGDYTGLDWLSNFQGAGASWDATGVHFYADCSSDVNSQLTYLQNFVEQAYNQFGKPVWVTEFGCDNPTDVSQNEAFINVAIPYLEGESKVAQYAYFKADYLVDNAAGAAYASLAIN